MCVCVCVYVCVCNLYVCSRCVRVFLCVCVMHSLHPVLTSHGSRAYFFCGVCVCVCVQVEVDFKDCELTHHSHSDDFKLQVPNFEVKPGEVCAIVGRVGSGECCCKHMHVQTHQACAGLHRPAAPR